MADLETKPVPVEAEKLSTRKARGKLNRTLRYAEMCLEGLREPYEEYVKLHRLIYDTDPEPEDVPNDW